MKKISVLFLLLFLLPTVLSAPAITDLTSQSITRTSASVYFNTSQGRNYTIILYADSDRTDVVSSSSNVNLTTTYITVDFTGLTPARTYYVNLSVVNASWSAVANNSLAFTTLDPVIANMGLSDLGTDVGGMFSNVTGAMLPGVLYVIVIGLILGVFGIITWMVWTSLSGMNLKGRKK